MTESKAGKFVTTEGTVEVETDHVVIKNLRVEGQTAQTIISNWFEGQDPVNTVLSMLQIGSVALQHQVSSAFITKVESAITDFGKQINTEAEERFPALIKGKTDELMLELGKFLDPKQVTSIQNLVKTQMDGVKATLLAELLESISAQKGQIEQALKSLGLLKKTVEASTQKGTPHEEYVGEILERFAGPVDIVKDMSKESGGALSAKKRGKTGDYLVTVKGLPSDEIPVEFVVEAKNATMTYPEALREIQDNMDNRKTKVGIIVFDNLDQAPTNGKYIKVCEGNRIMVVIDKADEFALYAAYMYARNLAQHVLTTDSEVIDIAALQKAINAIEDNLNIESKLTREANSIRNALDRLMSTALNARTKALESLRNIRGADEQ